MALAFCGARLSGAKLASSRVAHQAIYHQNARLYSAAVQHVGPVARKNTFRALQHSRHYFWSSKKPTEITAATSASTDETSLLNDTVTTTSAESTGLQDTAPVVTDESTTTTLSDATVGISADTTSVPATIDIPPLQFGDLSEMGLISWTPAGFVRWTIEAVQVSTGMPWFHTIVVTTLLYRIVLLPLGVKALRNSARLLPMTPRLLAVKKDMEAARASGDILAAQRVALKQKKIYTDAGVEMGAMILNPFVQLPVTLGLFFGVKGMCTLPVEQLKNSGLGILQDLTVPDPFYVLPVLATALINLQISVGSKEMNLTERPEMGHVMNFLRFFSIIGIYFLGWLPSGVLVTLSTGVAASAVQSLALQYKPLRRALNIPIVPSHLQGRLPTFRQTFMAIQKFFRDQQVEAHKRATTVTKPRRR